LFTDSSSVGFDRPTGYEADEAHGGTPSSLKYRITACEVGSPRRAEAEQYVSAKFHRTHGAHVTSFMPTLLLLTDDAGAIEGVAGCRTAGNEPLLLESYLEHPIEETIARRTGARVKRSQIVEVGNFACRDSRSARAFMSLIAPYLIGRDLVWITFTATVSVRRILGSLGARCTELGRADGACVRSGTDRWGSYYTNDPRVMVGYLPLARRNPALWGTFHAD
jgi:hypothetical protein